MRTRRTVVVTMTTMDEFRDDGALSEKLPGKGGWQIGLPLVNALPDDGDGFMVLSIDKIEVDGEDVTWATR